MRYSFVLYAVDNNSASNNGAIGYDPLGEAVHRVLGKTPTLKEKDTGWSGGNTVSPYATLALQPGRGYPGAVVAVDYR
jgi:hypothetical protein